MVTQVVVHCTAVSYSPRHNCDSTKCPHAYVNWLETPCILPAKGILCALPAQTLDPCCDGNSSGANLLWIPNRGKTPPNVDRVKLFAASALAAKVG